MQVEALIKELLATGSMNEDTTADLNRWAAEAAAGTLHPDDVAYIEALHAKVTGASMPEDNVAAPVEPVRLDGLSIEDNEASGSEDDGPVLLLIPPYSFKQDWRTGRYNGLQIIENLLVTGHT